MKTVMRFLIIMVITVISLASWVVPSHADPTPLPHPEHSLLLPSDVTASTLQRIRSIRLGMTRGDLLRVFAEEGGAYPPGEHEYVYGVPCQVLAQPQDQALLGINKKPDHKSGTLPSLRFSVSLQPLFINEQCIKVRVKFVSQAFLLASLVNPSMNLPSSGPSQEQRSDVIVSVSEPYWGCIVLD